MVNNLWKVLNNDSIGGIHDINRYKTLYYRYDKYF